MHFHQGFFGPKTEFGVIKTPARGGCWANNALDILNEKFYLWHRSVLAPLIMRGLEAEISISPNGCRQTVEYAGIFD
jgi:hypothetical protein